MNSLRILTVIVALAGSAYGQTFEAASIRENAADRSGVEGRRIAIEANPGSLVMRNVTLSNSLRWAYDVPESQIVGGEVWTHSVRYDIVARPAAAASTDQLRLMLGNLLAERFKLVIRKETKETAVYVLSVDKNGHKLRPGNINGGRDVRPTPTGLAFQNATMSDFQQFLSGYPGIDRPVVDRTALEDAFNFDVSILPLNGSEETAGAIKGAIVAGGIIGFADALTRVGLRLEPQKLPLDAVVIEKAEKPSEN